MVLRRHVAMQVAALALFLFALLRLPPLSLAQTDDQVSALLAIKDATGGGSTNLTSWNKESRQPCLDKWIGVTCDGSRRIIGLNVSFCGLHGPLPAAAFAKLTSLVSLDFSHNLLQSPFPALDQLTSLHDLNFSANNFTESFPTSIFSLTNLVELHLDNNFLSGSIPEQISNLELLEQFWLGNNTAITGPLPKGLATLYHLQTFSLWGTNLKATLPAEWGAWVNITYINLHNAFLEGTLPAEWGTNFTKLKRLHLYLNDLTGRIPDTWKGMISLTEFRFKNNELTGPAPSWFKNNTYVDFICNYLTGRKPSIFNDSTTWQGNCFDSDPHAHDQNCPAGRTCSDMINGVPKHKFPKGAIAGIIIAVIVVLCGILGMVYWTRHDDGSNKNNKRRRRSDQGSGDWTVPQGVRRFTHREISKATKSFDKSCEIGEGGFGKVYVAQLDDGKHVAIKRASDLSFQGTKEFQNEITLLSRLHHRHLVRLEGFCDDRNEQILVYEYMSNGNLHRHLLDKHGASLNWYRRLEIALAVAQGLDYLHTFADPPVIHRDVKPSNILLDENMAAKVADFGISKANPEMDTHVSTRPAGTAGYLDPEYFLRRQLTTASDVYGYGVVLLELITGQLAIDHKRLEDYNLIGWVKPKLVRKGINAIIDPRLGPNFPAEQYEEVAHLAMACTAFERGDRPSMQTVATTLERVLSNLVPPPEHLVPFSSPSMSPLMKDNETNSQISGGMTEPVSDVRIEFGSRDTTLEPR